MKAVLFYETGTTPMAAFGAAFPRHKVVYEAFAARGEVLGIGTFAGGRDGSMAIFRDRAAAEAFYSGPWLAGIRERYGMDPQIKYFETACITDNSVEAVLLPDAAE